MGKDERLLAAIRGAIAIKQIPQKSLARKCKVSRPYFSAMLHGDREMPPEVKERLIRELGLESRRSHWEMLLDSLAGGRDE